MDERIILHCDLNNFFASVECFTNPELKNKFVAVCGSVEERHGIVLAKNEAAKKLGVKTGEAIWEAKDKCPQLICVEPHYDKYLDFSRRTKQIYESYTDMVEAFGIDECWLDVTGSIGLFGEKIHLADEIRRRVKKEIGLTISVGVSFNKIFAKLGSDMKKPDAITVLERENMKTKIWPLPCEDLMGVGYSTQKKLRTIGINRIGQLAEMPLDILTSFFGKSGETLWRYANGLDNSPVLRKEEIPQIKSISRGVTCKRDLENSDEVRTVLIALTEKVAHVLRENKFLATIVHLTVRDNNLFSKTFQKKIRTPTRIIEVLIDNAMDLFSKNCSLSRPLRSVCISVSGLVNENYVYQMNMEEDYFRLEKLETLQNEVDILRGRYGKGIIIRASTLNIAEKSHIDSIIPTLGANRI